MNLPMKLRASALVTLAFCFAQVGFAATLDGCTGSGTTGLMANYTCSLYYNASNTASFNSPDNLLSFMTQGGALLLNNDFTPNYLVIINGNPNTLSDDASGLFNTSLWEAVLFDPGTDAAGGSDTLEVFWPGSFPSASAIQSFNLGIFGAIPGFKDSAFFMQATGSETVVGAGTNAVIDVFTAPVANTPEPASITLMATGLIGLLITMKSQQKALSQRRVIG